MFLLLRNKQLTNIYKSHYWPYKSLFLLSLEIQIQFPFKLFHHVVIGKAVNLQCRIYALEEAVISAEALWMGSLKKGNPW